MSHASVLLRQSPLHAQVAIALTQQVRQFGDCVHIGHGANNPIVSNASDAGKARNRRIEFVVYPERIARR